MPKVAKNPSDDVAAAQAPGTALSPKDTLLKDTLLRESLLEQIQEVWAQLASLRRCARSDLGPPPLLGYELASLEARIEQCGCGACLGEVRACLRACERYLGRLRSLERAARAP